MHPCRDCTKCEKPLGDPFPADLRLVIGWKQHKRGCKCADDCCMACWSEAFTGALDGTSTRCPHAKCLIDVKLASSGSEAIARVASQLSASPVLEAAGNLPQFVSCFMTRVSKRLPILTLELM